MTGNRSSHTSPELTSLIVLLIDVVQQLRVHRVQRQKQRLHGRIIGNTASPLSITVHSIDEYLDAALQGRQELLLFRGDLREFPNVISGFVLQHTQTPRSADTSTQRTNRPTMITEFTDGLISSLVDWLTRPDEFGMIGADG